MGVDNFDIVKANGYIGLPGASTGKVYYVSNATSGLPEGGIGGSNNNSGLSPLQPFSTIDYAVGRCTANRGDIIRVMPGHVEAVTAAAGLDLDVAGITIEFLGEGTNRGAIQFGTVVGADMDVDAANITLINPRFIAAIDALTGPIDVNAANFKMINVRWEDGTAINTTDCVVADANADTMFIDGFEFVDGDAAGTQKQSLIQVAGATGVKLHRIKCTGDFATGIIENGTAWIDAELKDCNLDNANASPTVAVLLQATSTGSMIDCNFRVASGTTYVTANNDMQFFECFGTGTDATAGEKIGTQLAGDVEAKVDVIDGYHDVPGADSTNNAQMRDVIGNKTDAAATGAVTGTDSLVGYTKQLVTELQVVDGLLDSPTPDSATTTAARDTIGNKGDAAIADTIEGAAATTQSLHALAKAILQRLGADSSNNTAATTTVAFNRDGSILERLEDVRAVLGAEFASANPRLGIQVRRNAADIFDGTAVKSLFTVSGGRVLLTHFEVEVTTAAIDAGASNMNFVTNPTVGTDMNLAANLDINADESGTIYSISGIISDAVTGGSGGGAMAMQRPIVVPEGAIAITTAADVGTGGALGACEMWYIPLDVGATVAPA